jgi:integrase
VGEDAEEAAQIVRRRLGHANIATTLGTYTHAVAKAEQDAAETLAVLVDAPRG